ncbi:hypothetical protein ACEXOS_015155 [Herbiconiux sp. P16]|uniref:hypothetical protein n=1 Tax=Herbiconiux wuyangfengii TaxID=3342794 RepID=UPI0035BA54F1
MNHSAPAAPRGESQPIPAIDFRFAPQRAWSAICPADDPHKSIVDHTGALLYEHRSRGFEAWSFDRVITFSARAGSPARATTQRTESAQRGIVETTLVYDRQTLTLRQFGHRTADGRRIDITQWNLECTDSPDTTLPALLAGLHVDVLERDASRLTSGRGVGRTVRRLPTDAPDLRAPWPDDTHPVDDFGEEIEGGSGAVALVSTEPLEPAHTVDFRPGEGFGTVPVLLGPGEVIRGAISVPLDEGPVPVSLEWADLALQATRDYWDDLELRRVTVRVPDPDIQDLLDACTRNILQARETVDGVPQLQVGPAVYRGLWVIDGHFMMECARYLGLDDAADAGMRALLRRTRDDGSIVESFNDPHIKETGIALASIVREAQLTGNRELLTKRWPTIARAGRFIDSLREASLSLPPDHPLHGIMPLAFGDGGLAGARAELTTVMWILTGLKYAAEAAATLGTDDEPTHRERYSSLATAFAARRTELMEISPEGVAHLPQNLPSSGRHHMIPNIPDDLVARHRRTQPATATWAMCHAVWPGELFAPDDPAVTGMLALFDAGDDAEGIPVETGWLPYEALWPYHSSFAAHAWLFVGRGDKAAHYLYAFANHAYPTRVWREEQALRRADTELICGDMPHNWASAEFIRLTIHLIAFERGDDLLLLEGLPTHWIDGLELTDHPTRFGRLNIRLNADDDIEGQRRLSIELGETTWARPTRILIRVPAAVSRIVQASDRETELTWDEDRHLALPPGDHYELLLS